MARPQHVAGVDGCKRGWFCLYREVPGGSIGHRCVEQLRDLVDDKPELFAIAVDIPIGLPDAGPRRCDREARALLGRPRSSSVFPAPIRPALHARDREEASLITAAADGRRVQAQAWNILPKIREVDALLLERPELRKTVFESHPEVAFTSWNGGRPMAHPKKTAAGRRERERLVIERHGDDAIGRIAREYRRRDVALDDIIDAFAVLRTAERLGAGQAISLPTEGDFDPTGWPMRIWY